MNTEDQIEREIEKRKMELMYGDAYLIDDCRVEKRKLQQQSESDTVK